VACIHPANNNSKGVNNNHHPSSTSYENLLCMYNSSEIGETKAEAFLIFFPQV
jgi:hypothetical protein